MFDYIRLLISITLMVISILLAIFAYFLRDNIEEDKDYANEV